MDRFLLNSVDHAIPAAVGQGVQLVVLKIPKLARSAAHYRHRGVEALSVPLRLLKRDITMILSGLSLGISGPINN